MERRLLCLLATMHILPLGYHTPTRPAQDECHDTWPRHQHHAGYIPYGRCQEFSGTTKTGSDSPLQA